MTIENEDERFGIYSFDDSGFEYGTHYQVETAKKTGGEPKVNRIVLAEPEWIPRPSISFEWQCAQCDWALTVSIDIKNGTAWFDDSFIASITDAHTRHVSEVHSE